ncbi:MAG: TRAP transporter fused permease subunit, partial [Atribacterota bacterium]|nr:TRAP transporter fused permease subunit [Atribacterota bacterium]
ANVATTGKITIPLMIKNGYTKEMAGAVEAVASTGGQLMPPVMGVVAFIMASVTSNHYFQICKTALFPALIFYLYLAFTIQLRAIRKNLPIPDKEEQHDLWITFKKDGYLLLSLVVLVYSLAIYMPPAIAAYNAILSLVFLFTIKTMITKKRIKPALCDIGTFLVQSLSSGAKQAAKLGLILACLGIMVELFVVTGFAQKISFQMIELSRGNLLLMLLFIAITCLLFGMGMPTVGTYMVVSVLSAPALVKLGIPLLAAHMFVFYFGLMAMVTPPVGVGVIVATGISEGNYFKTAFNATKLALPGFILPLFFIFRPEILWIDTSFVGVFITFVYILIGLFCLAIVFERHFFDHLKFWEIIFFTINSILLLSPGNLTSLIGLFLFTSYLAYYHIKSKKTGKTFNE